MYSPEAKASGCRNTTSTEVDTMDLSLAGVYVRFGRAIFRDLFKLRTGGYA
jgi:hypothetical protein